MDGNILKKYQERDSGTFLRKMKSVLNQALKGKIFLEIYEQKNKYLELNEQIPDRQ